MTRNGICENYVRYSDGDSNFLRCIATNIENGNPFLNWYRNQCYGSKTCDSAAGVYGSMAVDLECLSMSKGLAYLWFNFMSDNHLFIFSNVEIKFQGK